MKCGLLPKAATLVCWKNQRKTLISRLLPDKKRKMPGNVTQSLGRLGPLKAASQMARQSSKVQGPKSEEE
jgi:hypothetical protein